MSLPLPSRAPHSWAHLDVVLAGSLSLVHLEKEMEGVRDGDCRRCSLALTDHSSRDLPQEPYLVGLLGAVQQPLQSHVSHWSLWGGSRCRSTSQTLPTDPPYCSSCRLTLVQWAAGPGAGHPGYLAVVPSASPRRTRPQHRWSPVCGGLAHWQCWPHSLRS